MIDADDCGQGFSSEGGRQSHVLQLADYNLPPIQVKQSNFMPMGAVAGKGNFDGSLDGGEKVIEN